MRNLECRRVENADPNKPRGGTEKFKRIECYRVVRCPYHIVTPVSFMPPLSCSEDPSGSHALWAHKFLHNRTHWKSNGHPKDIQLIFVSLRIMHGHTRRLMFEGRHSPCDNVQQLNHTLRIPNVSTEVLFLDT